eukprot:CAMPEP_0206527524 /NCGR_PEP_ID=MMETSP0325_2-20121206/1397_1 /ASSEMBLY_ACC=CAM_ASM_000347 /TAXON_ID=2866 /ORGANISM="Crypthecodinium cohnii, Strain Seligo" /LENGTH=407 /DNA_ID=CAMNT_0054022945 /DNA_START=59 /DNA_END=1282 /DNA_ORIENTATION=-
MLAQQTVSINGRLPKIAAAAAIAGALLTVSALLGPNTLEEGLRSNSSSDGGKRVNANKSNKSNNNSNHSNNNSNNNISNISVFAPGEGGFACWRIPALVRTAKGSLLAFAEARHANCNDASTQRIGVRRSIDGGKTWSSVNFAAGDSQHFVGNPYPIALHSGRVVLVYVNVVDNGGKHYETSGNGLVWSDDDGLTWGAAVDVSKQFGAAAGSMPGPGAGLQLASGRLLVVLHHGGYEEDFIVYSDDEGLTWTTQEKTFAKMDEAAMADLGDGEVLLSLRSLAEPVLGRAFARSHDGGMTWSEIYHDHTLPGPVCQGSLAALNKTVFFSEPSGRGRTHLTLHRSDDGSSTWAAQQVVVEQATAGYSSMALGIDADRGGLLYEGVAPGSIVYTNFTLDLGYFATDEIVV